MSGPPSGPYDLPVGRRIGLLIDFFSHTWNPFLFIFGVLDEAQDSPTTHGLYFILSFSSQDSGISSCSWFASRFVAAVRLFFFVRVRASTIHFRHDGYLA
jgi:hypothetical protein